MSVVQNNDGIAYQYATNSYEENDISFFGWVKINDNSQVNAIFCNSHDGAYGLGWEFHVDDSAGGNNLYVLLCYVAYLESSLVISDNEWHFVGAVRNSGNGNTWTVYLDDTSEEVGATSPFNITSACAMVFGGRHLNGSPTPLISGYMAHDGYWEGVLTTQNIADLQGCVKNPGEITTNLKVYLPYVSGNLLNNDEIFGDFTEGGTLVYSSDEPCVSTTPSHCYRTLLGVGR